MGSVQFSNISKVYPDGFQAITDMNLEIEDGEFVILVGPSGCGKSTALRMVAGLEDISAGEMRIGDKIVNDMTPKERNIAMVFQSYALYPHMTVAENMGFALKLSKVEESEIKERVQEAANILDLNEHLDRKPAALSGGQRQRVAMGRAIVRSPEAFLMDEPLSNLDAKLRVQMRAEINELQNRLGVTTLYVTHDQVEAMTMGDRVAVLMRGLLQQAAPPQELYDNPENLFVAGFIGSPSMNLAVGDIRREGDDWLVEVGEATLPIGAGSLERYPRVREYDGGQLAVGMRPEHFVRGDEAAEGAAWAGREVTLVEMLGAEMLVHFATTARPVVSEEMRAAIDDDDAFARLKREAKEGASTFVARFDPRNAPKVGDKVSVGFRPGDFHFFDIDEGTALR